MATELATYYVQIVPSADGIQGKISEAMGNEAEKAGTESGSKFASKLSAAIGGGAAMVASAATALYGAVTSGITNLASYGDNIDKMSQKFGISAQAYQEWDAILQHSGTSIEAMKPAFKNLASLAENNAVAFEQLGISQEQVATMSTEDLFSATITALQGMEEGSQRTALATELLGKAGMELGPLLNTTAEDTEAMRQAVNDLGGVLSDDAVKDAAAFQDALQDMQTSMQGMGNQLLAQFLPSFTTIMDGLTKIFSGNTGEGVVLIREGMEEITSGILRAIPDIVGAAAQMVGEIIGLLIDYLPEFLDSGIQIIGSLISGISSNMPAIISKIIEVATTLLSSLMSRLPEFLGMGVQLIVSIIKGLVQAVPQIISSIGSIARSMLDSFKHVDWASIGRNVIDGIVNGLRNFGSNIASTLMGFAESAFRSVKNFFGINSPSRLFKDQIGKNIALGFAEGIEDNTDAVSDAIDDLNDITTSGFKNDLVMNASVSGGFAGTAGNQKTTNVGGIVFNITTAEGQNPNDFAQAIKEMLTNELIREEAVFA